MRIFQNIQQILLLIFYNMKKNKTKTRKNYNNSTGFQINSVVYPNNIINKVFKPMDGPMTKATFTVQFRKRHSLTIYINGINVRSNCFLFCNDNNVYTLAYDDNDSNTLFQFFPTQRIMRKIRWQPKVELARAQPNSLRQADV